MTKITIEDIAAKANVSTATVSRVINHSSSVTPETRSKVEQIIKELNYAPSVVARNLSRQKTTTIGVIIPQVDNPFFGHALRGIIEIAENNGYSIMCFNTDDHYEKDIAAIRMMKENRTAGLLFTPAIAYSTKKQLKNIASHLKTLTGPVVCFDRSVGELGTDEVIFDDETAICDAVTRLINAGHTRIGLINGSRDSYLGQVRLNGYLKAFQQQGMEIQEDCMFFGNLRSELGYVHAKQLLELKDRPSAVMLCNNEISYGFLRALHETNLVLGQDIQCIGLDKIDLLDMLNIKFNYIERDAYTLGKTAAELLLNRISNPAAPTRKILLNPVVTTPYL